MVIQSLAGSWEFRQAGTGSWLPASVPGGVHTDLIASGRIPDPFVGDNEKRVGWVAEKDWDYRCRFSPAIDLHRQPQVWLVCDGLDTLATVSLNGSELGRTANMFRQYRWDIKAHLEPGENELLIAFESPLQYAAAHQAARPLPGVPQAIPGGPYLRKAPCQFGWDWGPKLPPIGIWKDVRLEGCQGARIDQVRLSQRHEGESAAVEACVAVQSWDEAPRRLVMHLIDPEGQEFQARAAVSAQDPTVLQIDIPEPRLWWPKGYGLQPLYRIRIELHQAEVVLDRREYQLGLRTIELRQEPDEWGRCFQFIVNGVPIFAKGSNWIPADSFPTRIMDDRLERLISGAAETHQNMLRVWGGGFYEEERFYDLCDRYGILVWQDFIFSCSVYPLDDQDFVENLRHEVIENIRRLRHRACLALWCGNNEMEQGWSEWGWQEPSYADLQAAYDRFFHHTLPDWCATEDPERPYWPSSPSSGTPFENPNSQQQGDSHYWEVWHGGRPFTAYRDQYPRFMSEFGFQSMPPLATIRTYAEEAEWNITSYVMEQHQKNEKGNALMVAQLLDNFRLPRDFPALVYLSMVLQAEGIRYGVEHWRRHPERVAGTLYWQLNDCWPVASWSSLDYYGRWKALHYAARRFFAPLLLSIEDQPPRQTIWVSSDLPDPWDGYLRWSLEKLDGEQLKTGEQRLQVIPLSAAPLCELDFSDKLDDDLSREVVLIAELWHGGRLFSRQTAFFVPTKHLRLTEPRISAQLQIDDGKLQIQLSSLSLARLVECALEGADVVFSDNYFDLPAGRTATIAAPLPPDWTASRVQAAFKVRTVYESFANSPGS
jgi:beta-mannosidase